MTSIQLRALDAERVQLHAEHADARADGAAKQPHGRYLVGCQERRLLELDELIEVERAISKLESESHDVG